MPQPSANKRCSYDGDYMEAARRAEGFVLRHLKEDPNVLGVRDCRSLRVGQEADFDISITTTDGAVALAEVKSDKWISETGNMVFEIARVNHTAPHDKAVTLGWSARSPATWCIFYSPQTEILYMIRFEDFRRCFQRYSREARGNVRMKWISTDNIKSTLIALIPKRYWQDVARVIYPPATSF